MTEFVWPYELDDAQTLLAVPGSFWFDTYAGNDLVASVLHAVGLAHNNAYHNYWELLKSISRYTVPVYHTEDWYPLSLFESQLNTSNLPQFDGTYVFTGEIQFDVPVEVPLSAWVTPPGFVEADIITNQITHSQATYVRGVDYYLTGGVIWFRNNPFNDPNTQIDEVFTGNEVTDRIATLWFCGAKFDRNTAYLQFGYVLSLQLPSSYQYRDAINAVYDALVFGSAEASIQQLVAAVCDVPLAKGTETIEYVINDAFYTWVISDQNAYRFSQNVNVLVEVGQTIEAGDVLTDAIQFYDTNQGQVPDTVPSLSLAPGLLKPGYFGELVFQNSSMPLQVTENVNGYTEVEFPISGWPGDVAQFWDDVQAAGILSGTTLAMYLDTRTVKVGQPTAAALPRTINPLEFLVQNMLRGTLELIVIKSGALGPDALGLSPLRLLRMIVPPQTICAIIVQLEYDGDVVAMTGPGSPTQPGYEENVSIYLGASIAEEIDPAEYVIETVTLKQIAGYCV